MTPTSITSRSISKSKFQKFRLHSIFNLFLSNTRFTVQVYLPTRVFSSTKTTSSTNIQHFSYSFVSSSNTSTNKYRINVDPSLRNPNFPRIHFKICSSFISDIIFSTRLILCVTLIFLLRPCRYPASI